MQYDIDNFSSRPVRDVEVVAILLITTTFIPLARSTLSGNCALLPFLALLRDARERFSHSVNAILTGSEAYKQLLSAGAALFASRKLVP
jgi:hypothetical protein